MRDIGLDVSSAGIRSATIRSVPSTGSLPVRGQVFDCIVVSDKMESTVVVMREFEKKACEV